MTASAATITEMAASVSSGYNEDGLVVKGTDGWNTVCLVESSGPLVSTTASST